jgi:hypothetical protein
VNPLAIISLIEMCFGMLNKLGEELKSDGLLRDDHPLHQSITALGGSLPDAKAQAATQP